MIRPSSTGWWLPVAAGLTGYIDDGSIVAISIGLVAVSTWMIVIGASGFRLLSIIFVSFVVISGTIGVKWGMDTTGRSVTQLKRTYGWETSPPATLTAA